MITVRRSEARRRIGNGTQDTLLTFDPENEADPFRLGFRTLESLNEESPRLEMGLHPQGERELEVVTYVRKGALAWKDRAGTSSRLEAGEFLRMSASGGIGPKVIHGSLLNPTHVFQSGFTPNGIECEPGIEQKRFPVADREGVLRLVASSDGRNGSLCVQQDVRMYSSVLLIGHHLVHELSQGRAAWLHVIKGRISLQEHFLATGDATALENERAVSFMAQLPTEILLFDLA